MSMTDEFKKGLIFSSIGKYSNVIIQIGVTGVLSRILTPKDYSIVAVVNVFLVFFQMLADMGIGPAIIQNKQLSKNDEKNIFTFSVYLSVILSVLFMMLGYPISIFYNNEVYLSICIILGVCVFFYGLLVVPQSLLLKQKDFATVNKLTVLVNLLTGLVSISLALLGFNYYSIIISNIVRAGTLFFLFFIKVNIKPSKRLNMESINKIWGFSKNQFSFNFINYFSRNLDNILIGRFLNPVYLAYYDKAYQVSLYPNQMLTNVITPVIQPFMSEYENRKDILKKTYFKITLILGNLGVPLSVFLFFSAKEIIFFLFGAQWEGSTNSLKILALSVGFQMIGSSTGAIYQSANRTDLLLLSGIQSAILNIASIITGVFLGKIEFVAAMVVFSFLINFIFNNYLLLYRIFESNFLEFLGVLSKPIVMGVVQFIYFLILPELPYSIFINLIIKSSGFLTCFVIGLIVTRQFSNIKKALGK